MRIRFKTVLRIGLALSLAVPQAALASGVAQIGAVQTSLSPAGAGVAGVAANAGRIATGMQFGVTPNVSLGSSLPGMSLSQPKVSAGLTAGPALRTGSQPRTAQALSTDKTASPIIRNAAPASLPQTQALKPAAQPTGKKAAVTALGTLKTAVPQQAAALSPAKKEGQAPQMKASALGSVFSSLRATFDGALSRPDSAGMARSSKKTPAAKTAPADEEKDPLDLWFGNKARAQLAKSERYTSISLIKGSGSEWYWGQFMPDIPIRVLVGGQTMFITRITKGATKEIGRLTREDFEGYYSKAIVYGKRDGKYRNSIKTLREKLMAEYRYKSRWSDNAPRAITPRTKVRLVRFMPFKEARHLPENNAEPDMEARLRKPVDIPKALQETSRFLPRLVLVDLDLLGDRIPFDLLEDMGKLMKAGVTFVLLSKKTQEEVDKIIVRDLTIKQRDNVVRWKLYSFSNNGNTLYSYGGSFSQLIESKHFADLEQDILKHAADAAASGVTIHAKPYELRMRPKRGSKLEDLRKELAANFKRFGLSAEYAMTTEDGEVVVRPRDLRTGIPDLIEGLQQHAGLYLNNWHIMTVTRDQGVIDALPNAVHAGEHIKTQDGTDTVDTALAAMLGKYRVNVQGDLAASASSIKSFKYHSMGSGGFNYKVYMLLGHVLHTTLDWAIMVYNETGTLPTKEAVREKAYEIWHHEDYQRTAHLLEHGGETMAGYEEAMDKRLEDMYELTAQMLEHYPIALGVELTNLHVVENYKNDELHHRDIFRGLYDLVLAREVDGGLEVVVADFKTGQTPTVPLLAKDVQVLLYDLFARRNWPDLPVPFSVLGKVQKVVRRLTTFLYPSGIESPDISEFDRLWFEKFLRNVMNRIRKFKGVLTEEQIEKAARAARAEARNSMKKKAKAAGAKKKS